MNELHQPARGVSDTNVDVSIVALHGIPIVEEGHDIAELVATSADRNFPLITGDIVVIAQKIISKAEGRRIDLATVTPSPAARRLAAETEKDPRLVELILGESTEVLRTRPGLIIVAHRLGYVLANAGIDQSNVADVDGGQWALLLPTDPDASCRRIRRDLRRKCGVDIGVVINDSVGRAWRNGTIGTALGVDGLMPVRDLRGTVDLFGRTLQSSAVGIADEIAAAASLVQGQAGEGRPVVVVRGLGHHLGRGVGADLVRRRDRDLFR